MIYHFEESGGRTVDDRYKPHWPDTLHFKMNRRAAFDMISELMDQLRNEEFVMVGVANAGKMETTEDD